jgi:hypothetical protein
MGTLRFLNNNECQVVQRIAANMALNRREEVFNEYDGLFAAEDPETDPYNSKYKGRSLLVRPTFPLGSAVVALPLRIYRCSTAANVST